MKKSLVVGRKIVGVQQQRDTSSGGETVWDLSALELDNGSILVFNAIETEGGGHYVVKATVYPKRKKEE